jgi:DUF2924 family protein/resolvase-like protein
MSSLDTEIAALQGAATRDLKIAWQRLYHTQPPRCLSRDLLIRAIAYRLQERAHGGPAAATKRHLRSLVAEIETKGTRVFDPPVALKPGARLVREWAGRTYTVIVLDTGFEYEGERYPSLSRVAARITGAHWSGPRFFGCGKPLRSRMPEMSKPAPSRGGRRWRCAIYTRKSSEEGLEQAFNSLDAQREACEAYIKSQRHEGWTCLPQSYDDGGLSGATMDRPALQQLLSTSARAGSMWWSATKSTG